MRHMNTTTKTPGKRAAALNLITFAGYHGDKGTATRLYIENRVSYGAFQAAYAKGAAAKAAGVACGCHECRPAAGAR